MQRSYYVPTTVAELREGLRYAMTKFSIPLNGETLVSLFDKALERYAARKYTSRKERFSTSVFRALKGMHSIPCHRFNAYYHAALAMGRYRRNHPFPETPIAIGDEGPLRADEVIADRALYGLGEKYIPLN